MNEAMSTEQVYAAAFDLLAGNGDSSEFGEFRQDGLDGIEVAAPHFRQDSGWFNPMTGLGDSNDVAETHFMQTPLLHLPELAAIYYGDDLAYRVVSKLPGEALKRKPVVANKQATPEQVKAVQAWLDANNFHAKCRETATFARLFGDACLWVATPNDQTAPLARGERVEFLKQLDRRVLLAAGYYTDATKENLGTPSAYCVIPVGMTLSYQSLGTRVHESRLAMFHGLKLDPIQRAYNLGWNYSILQRIYNTIRDIGETWSGISMLLRELSIKVLKVKGLQAANLARPDLVRARLKLARQSLSVQHMLAIDADSENFDRVESGTLTGAAAILEQLLLRVAAAAEMPVTKLYGRSPSGMNSSGDEETREWYDTVATYQQNELKPPMMQVVEAVASALFPGLKGWDIEFPSLWQQTESEGTASIKAVADLDALLITNGVFTAEQIATLRGGKNGHWRPDYSSLDVSVAEALSKMPPPRPAEGGGDGSDDGDGGRVPPTPPKPPTALPVRAPGEPPIPGRLAA